MPQLIAVKFAQEEMPKVYDPNGVADLVAEEFVVADRDGEQDIGFVAGIEWISTEQLKRRQTAYSRLSRRATEAEKEKFFLRRAVEKKALSLCKDKAREFNLPMKISTARVSPRDERIIFHFTSDQRVDFRQLVRELSLLLKTRIELWQIGVRDETKQLDGFGVCGLRTCCSSWLPDFRPINIRMAKEQDIHLPPAKLSGLCGRLLCCLSYEVDQYREMGKALLPKGSTIKVEDREGVIIDRNVLMQTYTVQFEAGSTATIKAADIQDIRVPDQMRKMASSFNGDQEKSSGETKQRARKWTQQPAETKAATPDVAEETNTEEQPDDPQRKKRRRRRKNKPEGSHSDSAQESPVVNTAAPREHDGDSDPKKSSRRRRRRRGKRGGDGQETG